MNLSITYRSPQGRVRAYSAYGEVVVGHEPGPEADAAWEAARSAGGRVYDGAGWLDSPGDHEHAEPDRRRLPMNAPFPYFGGKRTIAAAVWARLGSPKQYIEPFCGSAAMLLAAPSRASLEVVNDTNGFIANFWRAVKHQPEKVAEWCDYPMSHIDLGARHAWLREHTGDLDALRDADWPGDAKIAGWWLWGQCAWIGAGWCDGRKNTPDVLANLPHASSAGRGIQAVGKIPHASNAGRGDDAPVMPGELLTSCGRTAWRWLRELANRLERTRITHGDWSRCLNSHYGGADTAVFLDPPYRSFGVVYGAAGTLVADECETWARENAGLRVALCGHRGDYQLDGWDVLEWSREKATYSGSKTTDEECIWFSPACLRPEADRQIPLF